MERRQRITHNIDIYVRLPRDRSGEGTATVRIVDGPNEPRRVLQSIKVLGKGAAGRSWAEENGNTPTGQYRGLNFVPSRNANLLEKFGPWRLRLKAISGNALKAETDGDPESPFSRSGFAIHGGRTEEYENNNNRLHQTQGCLRVKDIDILMLAAEYMRIKAKIGRTPTVLVTVSE